LFLFFLAKVQQSQRQKNETGAILYAEDDIIRS